MIPRMEFLKIGLGVAALLVAWIFIYRTNLILKVNSWLRERVFSDRLVLFSGRRVAVLLLVLGAVAIFSGLDEVTEVQPIKPNIEAAMLEQARANLGAGQYTQAIRRSRELVRANPKNLDAWETLALAAWASGQKEVAAQAVTTILRLDPYHPIGKSPIAALASPDRSKSR